PIASNTDLSVMTGQVGACTSKGIGKLSGFDDI
ncbi:MAG: hypothetical protein ACI8PD_001747, partial [Nitrospinales bacterium]